ncbi:GntR family transcriptional regulator [Sporosarcina sp. FA9]|uniref:GntR family transcriptional regulator n=1 Tax=Sporosarcina sp. FA9 TaxID=3413030 RepID=UPI003F65CE74
MEIDLDEFIITMLGRKMTTQEWVTDIVRKAILNGYYDDGKPIDTTELANKLSVSRMPVRMALSQLESEGLVLLEPHKKPFAVMLSPEEVMKICDIRCELEALAGKLAIKKITDKNIQELNELIIKMENTNDTNEYMLFNNEFHNTINVIAGNEVLQNLINQLRNNVERYLKIYLHDPLNSKAANDEHKSILQAFKERDSNKVEVCIRSHLIHTCESVIHFLNESKINQFVNF